VDVMAKIGRPELYSQEIADKICRRIADGFSLRSICEDKDLPTRETVRAWLCVKDDFSAQYVRAREEQADHYADEMMEIADTADDVQKARLQIDTRKWIASKLKPKKYGDKVTNEITGANGGPIKTQSKIVFVPAELDEEG